MKPQVEREKKQPKSELTFPLTLFVDKSSRVSANANRGVKCSLALDRWIYISLLVRLPTWSTQKVSKSVYKTSILRYLWATTTTTVTFTTYNNTATIKHHNNCNNCNIHTSENKGSKFHHTRTLYIFVRCILLLLLAIADFLFIWI